MSSHERVRASGVPSSVVAQLRQTPGVADVVVSATGEVVTETEEPAAVTRVLRILVESGVSDVATVRPTLQDVYLRLLGGPRRGGAVMRALLRGLLGGIVLQLQLVRGLPAMTLYVLVTTPLFAVSFLSLVSYTGRTDLAGYAMLAPAMMAVASTTWERMDGRLPLLVATPSSLVWLFCGRSWFWMASGTASGTIALLVLAPLFRGALPWPGVLALPLLIAVVAVGTYGLALTMGGLALRFTELRNVISNVMHLTMMALMECSSRRPSGRFRCRPWPPRSR